MSGHGHPSDSHALARAILRSSPVIVGIAVATFFLHHGGWLRGFETTALDTMFRLKTPQRVNDVVVVGITESDYRELFGGRSPLDPGALARVLGAVAAGRPSVVAVDLDTSDPSFRALATTGGNFVWAQDAIHDGKGVFEPIPIMGGREPMPPSGLALFPLDHDGLVRRYRPSFETPGGPRPALPDAVLAARKARGSAGNDSHAASRGGGGHGAPEVPKPSEDGGDAHATDHGADHGGGAHHDLLLNFAGDRYSFPRLSAGDVVKASAGAGWAESGPLRDKIVVLGGLYRAARDEYPTPLGSMAGSEVMAHAIASQMRSAGVRHASEVLMVILEILGGMLLVVIHHRLDLRGAMLVSLVAIPLFALVSSFLAFSSLALWANFVPLLAGVLIHQLYDHAREYRKLLAAAHAAGH